MTIPLLEIRDLCKSFPGKLPLVLDHVAMAVASGEIRGIVGESGCGKTTLARCSLRLLEPSSGRIVFDGRSLSALRGAELRTKRREFQMIFQDPYSSLNPGMTIEDILLEPLRIHKIGTGESRQRRVFELIESVSVDAAWMKRKPFELSGGQQQRVDIARALALKPRLLVADEPVSALDVSVQAQMLNLLSDLKKQYNLTLILISHSLYAIHYLCTHVSVMYRGRIVEESPADVFFANPKHPYSRILLDSMPGLNEGGRRNVRGIRENAASAGNRGQGCAFYPDCPCRMKVCGDLRPELNAVRPGEAVACFLYH
jgi:oligopeptide/dipeptide ABC transporter ATP-binding protein